MNLVTKISLFLIILFPFGVFCQEDSIKYPKVIVIDSDTIIAFTLDQSKELTLRNERLKECQINSDLQKAEIESKDSLIQIKNDQLDDYSQIEGVYNEIIKQKDEKYKISEKEKDILKKEVRKQKIQKWGAVILGSALVVVAIIF